MALFSRQAMLRYIKLFSPLSHSTCPLHSYLFVSLAPTNFHLPLAVQTVSKLHQVFFFPPEGMEGSASRLPFLGSISEIYTLRVFHPFSFVFPPYRWFETLPLWLAYGCLLFPRLLFLGGSPPPPHLRFHGRRKFSLPLHHSAHTGFTVNRPAPPALLQASHLPYSVPKTLSQHCF